MKIIWSTQATIDYHQNIFYLLKNWPDQVAIEFIDDVDAVIKLLESNPEVYPLTDHKEIRRVVVRKQITLFFKVQDAEIHLIRFWNTYQSPESLSLD
ncbi:MAG TPA: type II toxin-antitoxin system RelE/ParE family toxin [Chryseolinea sp.]|nr:type II toxin-antitoxin system RelE/ParE family toxin [Chryseolinea sp.]HPM29245.1 type II toxin-antitoxin system RelE/ParE family toxin [Chryseolinea sp.]